MNAYTLTIQMGDNTHTYVVVAESPNRAQAQLWLYLKKNHNQDILTPAIQDAQIEQLDLSCPGVAFEHIQDNSRENAAALAAQYDIPF